MQSLLNHTAKRLILALNIDFSNESFKKMILKLKYGFDGTHCETYNQRWEDNTNSDSHIFCSSIVPIELCDAETHVALWKNPKPSSVKLCRPIRLLFKRESTDVTIEEHKFLEDQIENLRDFGTPEYSIKFDLALTMIDGKVLISTLKKKYLIFICY